MRENATELYRMRGEFRDRDKWPHVVADEFGSIRETHLQWRFPSVPSSSCAGAGDLRIRMVRTGGCGPLFNRGVVALENDRLYAAFEQFGFRCETYTSPTSTGTSIRGRR